MYPEPFILYNKTLKKYKKYFTKICVRDFLNPAFGKT